MKTLNTPAAIIAQLKALSDPNKVEHIAKKFNVRIQNLLGVYHANLNKIARQFPKDSDRAIEDNVLNFNCVFAANSKGNRHKNIAVVTLFDRL